MLDAGPLLDPPFAGILPGCGTKVKPVWIHEQCAASAPEVWCSETTGAWHCVVEAIARARQIRCTCCRTSGAAICCLTCLAQRKGRGQKAYHFACAADTGWRFGVKRNRFFCTEHRGPLCHDPDDPPPGSGIPPRLELDKGERCEVFWDATQEWFGATVLSRGRSGAYSIAYDEGTTERRVPRGALRSSGRRHRRFDAWLVRERVRGLRDAWVAERERLALAGPGGGEPQTGPAMCD